MFTYSGRAALMIIMGPLLIVAPNFVGVVFGIISVVSAIILIFIFLLIKDSPLKKTFFHPFEPDSLEETNKWDFGEDTSGKGYQQQAATVKGANPFASTNTVSKPTTNAPESGTSSPAPVSTATKSGYNPFGASPATRETPATRESPSTREAPATRASTTASSSRPVEQASTNPFGPGASTDTSAKSGLEEVYSNPFDAKAPPPTNTSLTASSNSSRNPNNPFS